MKKTTCIAIQLVSIIAAGFGVYGFFHDISLFVIIGPIISFLFCLMSIVRNGVGGRIYPLLIAVVGMFICHFMLDYSWSAGFAVSVNCSFLVLSTVGLIRIIGLPEEDL